MTRPSCAGKPATNCRRPPPGRAKSPPTSRAWTPIIWSWTASRRRCVPNRSPCRRWTSSPRIIIPARRSRSFAEPIRDNAATGQRQKTLCRRRIRFCQHRANGGGHARPSGTAALPGGLLWSLRFHNRDGGFYWHSEPVGRQPLQGVPLARLARRRGLRRNQSHGHGPRATPLPSADCLRRRFPFPRRRNCCPSPMPPPFPGRAPSAPPVTPSNARRKAGGPWTVAGRDIDESSCNIAHCLPMNPCRPEMVLSRPREQRGRCLPSLPTSSARSRSRTRRWWTNSPTFRRSQPAQGDWKSRRANPARPRKTPTAPPATPATRSIYRLPAAIEGFRVFVFFPAGHGGSEICRLRRWPELTAPSLTGRELYYQGAGDYNYWKPALYHADEHRRRTKFLKIELTGETQIGRVEIAHALR